MNFYHNMPVTIPASPSTGAGVVAVFNALKEKLKLNGWTVLQTLNSAGVVSTADDFPSTSTVNNAVWVLLESPAGIITGGQGKVWLTLTYSPFDNASCMTLHNQAPAGGAVDNGDRRNGLPPTSSTQLKTIIAATVLADSAGSYLFNIVVWSSGAFWMGVAKNGDGQLKLFLSVYPLSDINYAYPYAIAVKAVYQSMRWSDSILDNALGWNFDGSVCTENFRFMSLQGAAGKVGYNLSATGDLAGNNLNGKIYLYNPHAGSICIVGKLGAEGYDFAITGCAAFPNGSVDASTPKRCIYGDLMLPANAVIQS
jgi:hypothetical protein